MSVNLSKQQSSFISSDDPPSPKEKKTGDRTMRFKLYWRHPGESDDTAVEETHEQITADPVQWSKDLLAWFNSTLRPHERKRIFVRCHVEGEVPPAAHRWFKASIMTKSMVGGAHHGSPYDAMQCQRCGVTGKRYGLNDFVTLDSKWKKAAFKRCDTSMVDQGKWKA